LKNLQTQSSKNFCHFCKKEISGKGDKEKIYHLSCFNLVTNFEKKNKKKEELFSILQKQFPYHLFLDAFETISEIGDFEAPGMSLTKLDDSVSCLIDLRYLNLSNNKFRIIK
jgi:hypothetical protein